MFAHLRNPGPKYQTQPVVFHGARLAAVVYAGEESVQRSRDLPEKINRLHSRREYHPWLRVESCRSVTPSSTGHCAVYRALCRLRKHAAGKQAHPLYPVNGFLLFILVILATMGVLLSSASTADAHHKSGFYLGSITSIGQTEQFCVEASRTSLSWETARDRVRTTLIEERTDVNWDMKLGGFTDFRTVWTAPCYNLSSSTSPTRSEVEIEYYVEDAGQETSPSWCENTSCAAPDGNYWEDSAGRTGYTWYYVWLRGELIKGDDRGAPGDRQHVVNHETGHVLGLADGGPTSGSWDDSCPGSVMHTGYYGCGETLIWPSLYTDHPSVNDIIQQQ